MDADGNISQSHSGKEPMTNQTLHYNPIEPTNSTPAELATGRDSKRQYVLDRLIVLSQRKRLVLSITAAFAILSIVATLTMKDVYTATVILLTPQKVTSASAALALQLGNLAGLGDSGFSLRDPRETPVAMLKSRVVEDAMIQRYGLMNEYHTKFVADTRKAWEGHATVDGTDKDGLIHIYVKDHDPRRAAELANGLVDQFRALSEHLAITEAAQRRVFFEKELQQAKDNLANAEEALKQTEQATGVIQIDTQARALVESAAELRGKVQAKEVQIRGMQTYATGQNPALVQAQRELEGLRAQLASLGGSDAISGGIIVPKGKVPEASLEYVRKLRDVKYYETIFDILARQWEAAKLDEAKEGAIIQVIDPAVPPDRKSFPHRSTMVIGATMIGLLTGILLALTLEDFQKVDNDPITREKIAFLRRELLNWKPTRLGEQPHQE